MNIVIAAVSAPLEMNGVSRHAVNLAHALLEDESASRVHFVAGEWQRGMFTKAIATCDSRFTAHYVRPRGGNAGRLSWYYRELPELAARLDANLVHLTFPAPLRRMAYSCPAIVSLHDLYPFDLPENFGKLSSAITRELMAGCIRHADGIACVSESTRSRLEKWFPTEARKSVTIPNVVEQDQPRRIDRPDSMRDDQAFILCVAQHRKNKNVALAILIFDRVLRQAVVPRDSQLLVVGIPGPETRMLRRLIRKLDLGGKVLMLNGMTNAELLWCYDHCRLLLAPSIIEGFGLPVAEAMLSGCPVVCSDIPAFREIGSDTCRYVAWDDDPVSRYEREVRAALAQPRPEPVALSHLSARTIGEKYMRFYRTLGCCAMSNF